MQNEVLSGGSNGRLDLIGVDDSGNIGVGQNGSLQLEVALLFSGLSVGSENGVQSGTGGLGPDDESTQLTTGGQGLQVKSVDISDLNTGDISESLDQLDVLIRVHDQRSFLHLVSLVSELALSGSQGLAVDNFLHVFEGSEAL